MDAKKPAKDPTWDLTQTPTPKLFELLHDYLRGHMAVNHPDYVNPRLQPHLAIHFHNMTWSVARELERRGIGGFHVYPTAKSLRELSAAGLSGGELSPGVTVSGVVERGAVGYRGVAYLGKALHLGSNERWITVHPHGEGEGGVPVLIRDTGEGTAHIIGGAGGSLNFVKLSNLKTPEEYRKVAKDKAAEKRAAEKDRQKEMSPEARDLERLAKHQLEDSKRAKQLDTIKTVYGALDMAVPEFKTPEALAEEGKVSLAAAKIALDRDIRAHLAYVNTVAKVAQEQVLADHDVAVKAGLGEISLANTSDTDLWGEGKPGIDLIENKKPDEGSGIASDFKRRAAAAGAGEETVKEESKLVRERAHEGFTEEGREAKSHEMAKLMQEWNQQVKGLQEAGLVHADLPAEIKVPAPEKIMTVLAAKRELEQLTQKIKKQKEEIKHGVQAAPFVVDTSEDVAADVVRQFRDEAAVRTVRAMLSQVEHEDGLTRHVRAGAFDALNEAGLTITANELLDRDVVDFLGSAGAAQLMAARLKASLAPEEYRDVAEAVDRLHGKTNVEKAQGALDAAKAHLDAAKAIELSTVDSPLDIVAARSLNAKRLDHLDAARQVLGDAYGRVTALGELSLALKNAKKNPEPITIDMGDASRETAITMARSMGLVPETRDVRATAATAENENRVELGKIAGAGSTEPDYRIESHSGHTIVTLNPSAFGKVTNSFDAADMTAYREAQAIKNGSLDEEGWLPAGIERRAATTFQDPTFELDRFDDTLTLGPETTPAEMRDRLEDFVGAKVGEGMGMEELRSALYSAEFEGARVPPHLRPEFARARAEIAPLGELTVDEMHLPPEQRAKLRQERQAEVRAQTQAKAEQFSRRYKEKRGLSDDDLVALNTQRVPLAQAPEQVEEAIHRTIAAVPRTAVAFTPLGQLDHEGKASLRDYFARQIAQIPKTEKPARGDEEKPKGRAESPPEKPAEAEQTGFGFDDEDLQAKPKLDAHTEAFLARHGVSMEQIHAENQAQAAEQKKAEAKARGEAPETDPTADDAGTPESKAWSNYVKAMGGQQAAYETVQAVIRGEAAKVYAQHHGRVFGRPLKVGTDMLPHWERHLIGMLPEEKLKAALGDKAVEASRLMAQVASRVGGKFAREGEGSRREAADKLVELMRSAQLGLFEDKFRVKLDRPTVGHDAEKQLASAWGKIADNFNAKGGGVKLIPDLSMSGDKVKQQRAVRLVAKNRRVGLHLGAGSGKSIVSIGAFTQLHSEGKAHKAVYAVPSAVAQQFGSEMLRFTTPGKYRWLADPSAKREDRFAAYKDPSTHMIVCTHQAFRDDILHALAQHRGITPQQAAEQLAASKPEDQRQMVKEATDAAGWKIDMTAVDEAHGLLNRAGKANSSMADAIDAFTYHMPTHISMTGTPVKNDPSEAFDVLRKLAPHKFTDRDAFMRRYGVNTPLAKGSLQRLMARYTYSDRIPSGVNRTTEVRDLPLTPKQQEAYGQVMGALGKIRTSRRSGQVDVEAVKTLAPEAFADAPEAEHQQIADRLAKAGLGGRLQHRLAHVVNGFDYEHNAKINSLREDLKKDGATPTVIFAHNYDSIRHIQRLLKEEGIAYGVVSGKKNSAEKAAARLGFQPDKEGQEAKFRVLINTDAGATGQNLQRGSIIYNYDTPDTAMTHEQRIARIDRIGQKNDVTVRDLVTDTPFEHNARKRLDSKYALADVFQSPSQNLDDSGLAQEIQSVRAERRNGPERRAA